MTLPLLMTKTNGLAFYNSGFPMEAQVIMYYGLARILNFQSVPTIRVFFSGRRDRKEGSCYYSPRAFWAENIGEMSSTKVSILSLNYT